MLAHSKLISNLRFLLKFGPQSLKHRLQFWESTKIMHLSSDVVLDKLCKECGKGFQSRKALFGTWIGIEIKIFYFFLNTEIYYKPNTT